MDGIRSYSRGAVEAIAKQAIQRRKEREAQEAEQAGKEQTTSGTTSATGSANRNPYKTVIPSLFKPDVSGDKLESAGIWRRYKRVSFDVYEKVYGIPQCYREQYAVVKRYACNLTKNIEEGRGLILAGTPGSGKTTLAVAILRELLRSAHTGYIIGMDSLMDNLYTKRAMNREEWAEYEDKLRRVHLLILDDLGQENTDQGWVLCKVNSIITERYNKKLSTIITTNLNAVELAQTYAARIVDRLRECNEYVEFKGNSLRRNAHG